MDDEIKWNSGAGDNGNDVGRKIFAPSLTDSHTHTPIPNHPGLHKELLVRLSCTRNLAKLGWLGDRFGDLCQFGFLTYITLKILSD